MNSVFQRISERLGQKAKELTKDATKSALEGTARDSGTSRIAALAEGDYWSRVMSSFSGGYRGETGRGARRKKEMRRLASQPTTRVTKQPTTPYHMNEVSCFLESSRG